MGIFDTDDGTAAKINLQDDDVVTAEEFRANNRSRQLSPERRLLLAILDNAIDFIKRKNKKDPETRKPLQGESCESVMTDDDDDFFSFNNVCEMLNINPTYLRRALVKKYPVLSKPINPINPPKPDPPTADMRRRAVRLCNHPDTKKWRGYSRWGIYGVYRSCEPCRAIHDKEPRQQ